jgi:hypothetical protein
MHPLKVPEAARGNDAATQASVQTGTRSEVAKWGAIFGALAFGVIAGEVAVRRLPPPEIVDSTDGRAANVLTVEFDPAKPLVLAKDEPLVVMLGTSQIYARSSLARGEPIHFEGSETTLDQFARQLARPDVQFARIGSTMLGPFEMAAATAWLRHQGHAPQVVVFGITWANWALERDVHQKFRPLFRDQAFVASFIRELTEAGANEELLAAVRSEVDRSAVEAEVDASLADRSDRVVSEAVAPHVSLIGDKKAAQIFVRRELVDRALTLLANEKAVKTSPIVPANLEFNLAATKVFVRLLRKHGTTVFVYRSPERTDVPPFTANDREEAVLGALLPELAELGAVVVDAHAVVPNELWGWSGYYVDRFHFTREGHALLARFLAAEGAARGVFDSIEAQVP